MATVRRLSNQDVMNIFDCVHNNRAPIQRRLMFKIVVVGPHGMKLSPPSYQFEDGLYILLKPLKKHKGSEKSYSPQSDSRIPQNLRHCVFMETPQQSCPWSLSGPQFPLPTAIQQRYCYPKGDHTYSSIKGGALWTCYDEDGREDLEYRLLHVYYSAKRAGNKSGGIRLAGSTVCNGNVTNIPTMPSIAGNSTLASVTPTTKKRKTMTKIKKNESPSRLVPPSKELTLSPSCGSPLSFDMPPESPFKEQSLSWLLNVTSEEHDNETEEQFITPERDCIQGPFRSVVTCTSEISEQDYQHQSRNVRPYAQQSHFHRIDDTHYAHNMGLHHDPRNHSQPYYGSTRDHFPPRGHYHCHNMPPPAPYHSFSMGDSNDSSFEVGSVSSWGEPPRSNGKLSTYPTQQTKSQPKDNVSDFAEKLRSIHQDIKNQIARESKEADKGRLVSFLSSWAKNVSLDPLGLTRQGVGSGEDYSDKNCTAV